MPASGRRRARDRTGEGGDDDKSDDENDGDDNDNYDDHIRYDDGACDKELQCSVCNFALPPRGRLRGMCKNQLIDTYYTLLWDKPTNLPYYQVPQLQGL